MVESDKLAEFLTLVPLVRPGYYTATKIEERHDCDFGPCKIFTVSNGTDRPLEVGIYLEVPTDNPSGLLEKPLDGSPRLSILPAVKEDE